MRVEWEMRVPGLFPKSVRTIFWEWEKLSLMSGIWYDVLTPSAWAMEATDIASEILLLRAESNTYMLLFLPLKNPLCYHIPIQLLPYYSIPLYRNISWKNNQFSLYWLLLILISSCQFPLWFPPHLPSLYALEYPRCLSLDLSSFLSTLIFWAIPWVALHIIFILLTHKTQISQVDHLLVSVNYKKSIFLNKQ